MKYFFVVLIAALIGLSIYQTANTPLVHDSLFYTNIAQMIGSERAIYTPTQVNMAGTHPLGVPLLYLVGGRWAMPCLFAAFLWYFWLITRSKPFTFLLAAMPLLVVHSTQFYADLPLAALYFVGITQLWEYLKSKGLLSLVFAALALGLCLHTKALAVPLIGVAVVVFTLWHAFNSRKWWRWLVFVSIIVLFYLPLHASNSTIVKYTAGLSAGKTEVSAIKSNMPGTKEMVYLPFHNVYVPHDLKTFLFGTTVNIKYWGMTPRGSRYFCVPKKLWGVLPRIFNYADWGLLWFAVIILTALRWKQIMRSNLKYLLAVIVLDFGAICYALWQPAIFPHLLDGTMVQRMILSIVPITLFYVFLLFYGE